MDALLAAFGSSRDPVVFRPLMTVGSEAAIGPVVLLVVGFDGADPLAADVEDEIGRLRSRGVLRILDVLYISKDEHGRFRGDRNGSTLWQLLEGDETEAVLAVPLELSSAAEVGLDLTAAEQVAGLIEPGTSALLMLVEPTWVTDVLEAAAGSGGVPLVFGCLEPETMLLIGPHLASAGAAERAAERTASARGERMLDALASSTIAADVVSALVEAQLLDSSDVEEAIKALAAVAIIPSAALERARQRAKLSGR